MRPAPRRWVESDAPPLPGLSSVLGTVLAARGLDTAAAAALLDGAGETHDPFALAGMPEAVIHLGVALSEGTRIAVYGDYDADGVTACAMLTLALRAAGADVVPYIPNRMTEGYGLHGPALQDLAARGVGCVVTVDCGTSSVDVAAGRPAGMRLLITDHHLPLAPQGRSGGVPPSGEVELPRVDALVNPKRPDCTYPFDALAGAGVAWKLLAALEAERVVPAGSADAALGLAALGTVADMMPLRGENRLIVRRGLEALAGSPSPGVAALCAAAGVRAPLRASDLAFGLAPRINAAGRMEDAELALRLLLSGSAAEAEPLAARLQRQNVERQEAVTRAMVEAEERVAAIPDDAPAIVLGDARWPMGIVGLVAGRLAERYARPTFIASLEGEEAKGSARSVRGVHLVRALGEASDCLLRYGGHAVAAGFSLEHGRLEEFAGRITAAVAAQLGDAPRERTHTVEATIGVADLVPELCAELGRLEPCGQGNHEPLLCLRGATVVGASSFGASRQHLKVNLTDASGRVVEAVAFNKPGLAGHLPRGRRIDALFGADLDRWNGVERVRLRLRDLRPAREALAAAVAV
ncbi:MAG: single-stranded-DNA-specific exonuclease [Chloroflexota bacterium]|jgi:single-stranded-DNA-specific exonuclease|nr:single-stranded-DNA-specific exonuclease [Chloroflexota bacterium]